MIAYAPSSLPARVLLLGAGELGKELTISLKRLGCLVVACDSYVGAPAMQVADEARIFDMTDPRALAEVLEAVEVDLVVPEVEAIATELLLAAEDAGRARVVPNAHAVRTTMDRQAIRALADCLPDVRVGAHRFASSADQLRAAIAWARSRGAVIVSDECYAALPWTEPHVSGGVPSLLDADVCGGDPSGLVVLYSLSKQSNLAGYRAALVYGDPRLVAALVEARKHSGMMVPAPVQHAMAVALADEAHVRRQRDVYGARRARLLDAVGSAGLVNDPRSVAGLYLWLGCPGVDDDWELVRRFADLGILVAPGAFYGDAARGRVRMALTATDERIGAAASRIASHWG